MLARASLLLLALLVAFALVGCDGDDPDPAPGQGAAEEGPRGPEDIVQHLVDPPGYPAPVADDAELAELRNAEGTNRHHVYLAELGESATLEGDLTRGSVVLVADAVTVTVPGGASTAGLDGATVSEVGDCPEPCEVAGPALIAPTGWLTGIGVAEGWELVVPAPDS